MKIKVITPVANGFYKEENKSAIYFSLKKGEIIDVPRERAIELVMGECFEPVDWKMEKPKVKPKPKQKPMKTVNLFIDELEKLPKIGKKTAADIVKLYPNKESLQQGIKEKKLPFDDDVEKIIIKKYGGK